MAEGYHDFSAGEDLTAANLEDYCQNQGIMRFASAAARDTALSAVKTEGMFAYLKDVNTLTVYTGSVWSTTGPVLGALTSWTPTVTQSSGVTVTITYAKYVRDGRSITLWFSLAVTGSGSAGQPVIISGLPATAAASTLAVGFGEIYDVSAGSPKNGGYLFLATTTTMDLRDPTSHAIDNRHGIGGNFIAALAAGDTLNGFATFEVASDA